MGKKIRYKLLKGSLLQPLFQFTNKVEFSVNPVADPRGTDLVNHWFKMTKQTKPKFKGQNFESILNYDLKSPSSYVVLNFVNGWKHGFFFRQATHDSFVGTVKNINKIIQYERALQGFDDEYEDED